MKLLFRLSLIVSILMPVTAFGFTIFAFGGCIIFILTPAIASLLMMGFFLLFLSSIIFLVIALIIIFTRWKLHRARLLLPPVLIILGFFASIPVNKIGMNICQRRFQKHFLQYEQAAKEIENSITPDGHFKTTFGLASLSYLPPLVYREDDGSLTIEFVVGGLGPPPRHTAYLYRSNGIIEKGSRTSERWHRTTQIKAHWFRAND